MNFFLVLYLEINFIGSIRHLHLLMLNNMYSDFFDIFYQSILLKHVRIH